MALDPLVELLALCAHAIGHPAQQGALLRRAATLDSWDGLAALAEQHGMAPLLTAHLGAADITLPVQVRAELRGYTMQHAHAAELRTQALADILTALGSEGIDVLVLKGAALAHTVYPQPTLRPMRDLDLLLRPSDVRRAHMLLGRIGFAASPEHVQLPADHHHLAALQRRAEGFAVSVELHHTLNLNERGRRQRSFAELAASAQTFTVAGVMAVAPSREAMLWHVYRHALCMPLHYEPVRLIWIADLVSLADAWQGALDWELVRRRYPGALNALRLLHQLTPLPETLQQRLALGGAADRRGVGMFFTGWPRPAEPGRPTSRARVLEATMFPSPWWLRLAYGHGSSRIGYWRGWLDHQRALWPLAGGHIFWRAGSYAKRRLVRLVAAAQMHRRR